MLSTFALTVLPTAAAVAWVLLVDTAEVDSLAVDSLAVDSPEVGNPEVDSLVVEDTLVESRLVVAVVDKLPFQSVHCR